MKYRFLIPFALAGTFVAASGTFQKPLIEMRQTTSPVLQTTGTTSPLMAFLPVALGGFRGIMADVLWMRLTLLQDDGSYIEVMQLADWITALIPHASEIWSYQAWNMSYNLSAAMSDNEERWAWVCRGLALLSHEALERSPDPATIDWEIGHIYQHKIASSHDRTHEYYKRRLAESISILIPEGRLDKLTPDEVTLHKIHEKFGLDVQSMHKVEAIYGALDWRLASTHAIYWAIEGKKTAQDILLLNCDRMIYQSLAYLFRSGTIHMDTAANTFSLSPDLDKFSVCQQAYESAIRRHHSDDTTNGYIIFLKTAVRLFHESQREEEARHAFNSFVTHFPDKAVGITYEQLIQPEA